MAVCHYSAITHIYPRRPESDNEKICLRQDIVSIGNLSVCPIEHYLRVGIGKSTVIQLAVPKPVVSEQILKCQIFFVENTFQALSYRDRIEQYAERIIDALEAVFL